MPSCPGTIEGDEIEGGGLRSRPAAYFWAFSALVAAVLLRLALEPAMHGALPLVTLFGAVAATVWVGGIGPAVVVAVLGYVACSYLFIEPRGSLAFRDGGQVVGFLAYLLTCALVIVFGELARTARNRARLQREMLRVTLRSIGDAVITTDNEGRITYLNEVAQSLTGWTHDEASGRPLEEVFRIVSEATHATAENPALRALREGVVVGLANHTLLIRKDGTERPIEDSVAPIRNEAGEVSGCVLIFRDVTEQRREDRETADELVSARLLAAIVESSDDAIVSKSLDGVIRSWNGGAERMFGYTAQEAIGRHISIIIPPNRIAEEDEIIARLKAGHRVDHFETERVAKDGRRVLVSLTISPIKDEAGKVTGASKIARDVTDRKRLEDDLVRLAANLAQTDRRKDEFLAMLAHELRNPLAPISNMLEVMKLAEEDRDMVRRARETMGRQLAQIVRLVDDLLDISRISHQRLELRRGRVELAPVIQQAVEATRPLLDAAGHELHVSVPSQPIPLHADPARLAQVFGNLLSNSSKYTNPGGRIWLTAERLGDQVVVTIKDTGIGIPPEKLHSIFDMFMQVDRSLVRSQSGLGIGLTLVKRLVEMHGGSVEARSDGEGKGSEFVVRLPVLPPATAEAGPEPAAAAEASHTRRILVVDDNKDSAQSLAMLLKIAGNETFTAHDGNEAMAAAERHRPQVVLLDIGLPMLSGHDVCRRIREKAWGKHVVLIAVTGWGQDDDRRKAQDAGFDHHLVKPVDHAALLQLLGSLPAPSRG
jgi:PAS domain S-box-containing protein